MSSRSSVFFFQIFKHFGDSLENFLVEGTSVPSPGLATMLHVQFISLKGSFTEHLSTSKGPREGAVISYPQPSAPSRFLQ